MASSKNSMPTFATLCFLLLILSFTTTSYAQLSENFYEDKCPKLYSISKAIVKAHITTNGPRFGAFLVRIMFHDCFVNGCDASVLLDIPGGEKESIHNVGSLLGFEVIDAIKKDVEAACPGVVSCADLIALAARDAVVALGGPNWKVEFGRRDSTTASAKDADAQIPFGNDNLDRLIASFSSKGLSVQDLVALSGAHTLGFARCVRFRDRIYGGQNIAEAFAQSLKKICPATPGEGDSNLAPLDHSPAVFNNDYYVDLIKFRGLLHSDQQLFIGLETDPIVKRYAYDESAFFKNFAASMAKMGRIGVITGYDGVIRTNCRAVPY